MKIDWNTKYTTIAMYSFIVICSVIIFFLFISDLNLISNKINEIIGILQPFIIGFFIAYLMNFILKFYENKVFEYNLLKKIKIISKSKRGIGILFTYITAITLIYLFVKFVLPQLMDSIVKLINDIPVYITDTTNFIDKTLNKLNIEEKYLNLINHNFNTFFNYIIKNGTNVLPILGGVLSGIVFSIWNIILGMVISIYLLIDKERFCALSKKVTYGILPKSLANKVIEITYRSNCIFGKFLIGKIVDSAIVGVLTFILLTIFKMPYTILIAVIVGVTNIIPFFGPILGAIPAVIITFFISPIDSFWILIIILTIQQIDGNIIAPKILGNSIGISAFWILFSILVAGRFFGVFGMIIGVPLFALMYSIAKEIIENRLKKKEMKVETKDYL